MTSGWISFNEKTFKRLIYDNKTASCSNVGCKVDDFSISEKDEDVKDYSGEDGGDGESDGDGEGAREMTAKTTMKDTAKTKKSR
jgi:hypothetical protein